MGTVRKPLFAGICAVGFAATGVLSLGIAHGDLPVNIAVSGQNFTATISSVSANSATVYPRSIKTKNGVKNAVAISLGSARVTDLCLAMVAHDVPLIGDITFFVRAPGPATTAQNLTIDADKLGGDIGVNNLVVGAELPADDPRAATLTSAIVARSATMANVKITATSVRAAALKLTGVAIGTSRGDKNC